MIRYLIDSSALWRILRDDKVRESWSDVLTANAIGSCNPQRIEFIRSARSINEYEDMRDMFAALYPNVAVPKGAWQWIDSAQYRLLRYGAHRALSAVDLLICATAADRDLVVLHDDADFATASRWLPDVRDRSVFDLPAGG
jgi:predicted nucleic acid-binding protein